MCKEIRIHGDVCPLSHQITSLVETFVGLSCLCISPIMCVAFHVAMIASQTFSGPWRRCFGNLLPAYQRSTVVYTHISLVHSFIAHCKGMLLATGVMQPPAEPVDRILIARVIDNSFQQL